MKYDYDLAVIGGGAAGLTASGMGATLGAKTLLIEEERLGGDCTWTGCIPSKTLLHAARMVRHARRSEDFGLSIRGEVDFGRVMEHVRRIRQNVYETADRPERIEAHGAEVRSGSAKFLSDHQVAIAGSNGVDEVSARYVIVATGGRPAVPGIEGLGAVPHLTNESLFEITDLPQHLIIIGAGPVGSEMAQAFRSLGSAVTVVDMANRIQSGDDGELAGMLQARLEREGVQYALGASIASVRQVGDGLEVHFEAGGERGTIRGDRLLVAAGRRPNIEHLGLENANVAFTEHGITVDNRCRTSVKHIFAVGDVTGRYQFTHMSEHMAKVAVANALLKLPSKIDARHVPWVTYTDPELAHVGATEETLKDAGRKYGVYRFPYSRVDRAVTEGDEDGLIKIFARPWDGKILGASILGTHAGESISEIAVAMKHGVSLRKLSDTIHPYPTFALGVRRAADQWYVQKHSSKFVKLLQRLFGYRGPVIEHEPGTII